MDIGKVLSRAWNIIWNHKILWVFGILASCGARSGGGGGGGNSFSSDSGQDFNPPPQLEQYFNNLERSFQTVPDERWLMIGLLVVCAFFLLFLVTWLVGLYGKTGLTIGTLRAEDGRAVTFREIWSDSWGIFDRVVGLNFLLALPPLLLSLVVVVLVIVTFGLGVLCLIPLACLMIPITLAYTVFGDLANIALIKERLSISASIQRGWEVLSTNLGNLAVLALILIVGGFIVNLLLALPFFVAALPLLIGAVNGDAFQNITITLICVAISLPFLFVAGGIVQSYLQSAWTLAYGEVTRAVASKR